jgi:hypothetical protein
MGGAESALCRRGKSVETTLRARAVMRKNRLFQKTSSRNCLISLRQNSHRDGFGIFSHVLRFFGEFFLLSVLDDWNSSNDSNLRAS